MAASIAPVQELPSASEWQRDLLSLVTQGTSDAALRGGPEFRGAVEIWGAQRGELRRACVSPMRLRIAGAALLKPPSAWCASAWTPA